MHGVGKSKLSGKWGEEMESCSKGDASLKGR